MKYKNISVFLMALLFVFLFQTTVYADSSWHWLTTSPLYVLPFAVVFTIAIETFIIAKFGSVINPAKKAFKVFCVVCVSNIFSFIFPYVFVVLIGDTPVNFGDPINEVVNMVFNEGPSYIITLRYLIMTLFVEIPIVYFFLRKDVLSRKKLVLFIAVANIITTLLVAITEHVVCKGVW
ncbi:MAG: hypothetical protein Q8876_01960 [Bacillota bacterium]|nr:hypothetical protein [Bacillota bacterium]